MYPTIGKRDYDKGFRPKGTDPKNGLGSYINPMNDRQYRIDPQSIGRYPEPNHVDVSRLKTYTGSLEKRGLLIKMINITNQIVNFRNFLVHSWNDLDLLMVNHNWDDDVYFIDDWVQVNWEFLVERELLEKKGVLQSYLYNSNRVLQKNLTVTQLVICRPKLTKNLFDDISGCSIPDETILVFAGFVKKLNPGYGWYPPFDYVTVFTLDRKLHYKLQLSEIEFYLCSLDQLKMQ